MTKFLAIAFTITALAIGNTFAGDCGGCCGGKKDDKKKDDKKESVMRDIQL